MPSVLIRRAGPDDAAALGRIGAESFRAAYGPTTAAADVETHVKQYFSTSTIRDAMTNTACNYLLASVDAAPAGMLKLRPNTCPVEVPATNAIEIQLLYVAPESQRFGLGGRLAAAALEYAQQQEHDGAWLSAWEEAGWAIAFYTKHGFRQVGTQEFRVGATSFTDLVMYRPIDV